MRAFLCSLAAFLFVLLTQAPLARAQAPHESTISIAPDGVVSIGVVDCDVHVVGSARKDVKVTALADVRVTGEGDRVSIGVHPGSASTIDVAVPAGVHLDVHGIQSNVTVHDVSGPVQVGTVDGSVSVDGAGRDVEATSVSGSVDVSIKHGDVRASSVSGSVAVHLPAGGTASARTVSGSIQLGGAPLTRVEAHTMSGTIDLDARLEGDGPFQMHTHSGNVRVAIPRTPPVIVDVRTRGGRVDNPDAGAPAPGAAHTVLTVWTFSGDVHVERK
jgi:DUF4097 and DUF4098 domain-containing protein YvlB